MTVELFLVLDMKRFLQCDLDIKKNYLNKLNKIPRIWDHLGRLRAIYPTNYRFGSHFGIEALFERVACPYHSISTIMISSIST